MATFITSKSVGESINICTETSSGYWKYEHDGQTYGPFACNAWLSLSITSSPGEFTIISCDVDGNVSGDVTTIKIPMSNITSFDGTGLGSLTRLELPLNEITSFVGTGLESLTHLELQNGQLTSFDGTGLTSLTHLLLYGNQLTSFDGTGLTNLVALYLNQNQLTSFDDNGLTSLMELYLSDNQLASFDGTGLGSLTRLEIDNNQLTSFSGTGLSSLTQLYLNSNQLTSFDGTGLSGLTYLSLSGNWLTSFSGTGLTNLQYLYLQGNHQLTSFNGTGWNSLYELNLESCSISSVSDFTFSNIQNLYLASNSFTSFNASFSGVRNLSLNNNGSLTSFDGSGIDNLESLILHNCNISSLDNFIFPTVTYLYLDNNQIESFDGTGLSGIGKLGLSYNPLTSFNGSGMTGVEEIALEYCNITSLDNFSFPSDLITLSLWGNSLQSTTIDSLLSTFVNYPVRNDFVNSYSFDKFNSGAQYPLNFTLESFEVNGTEYLSDVVSAGKKDLTINSVSDLVVGPGRGGRIFIQTASDWLNDIMNGINSNITLADNMKTINVPDGNTFSIIIRNIDAGVSYRYQIGNDRDLKLETGDFSGGTFNIWGELGSFFKGRFQVDSFQDLSSTAIDDFNTLVSRGWEFSGNNQPEVTTTTTTTEDQTTTTTTTVNPNITDYSLTFKKLSYGGNSPKNAPLTVNEFEGNFAYINDYINHLLGTIETLNGTIVDLEAENQSLESRITNIENGQ